VYASPEQFGHLAVGPASDVYSLGVVLYELVTGVVPFSPRPGEAPSVLARRHLREKPRHPRDFVSDLPEAVSSLILSLLEKKPLERPTVAAAQNQVKRLRERFKDALREGPTQIKANPLPPETPPETPQVTPLVTPLHDQLPPKLSTADALASLRRDRRPMVMMAAVVVLLLLGLAMVVRMGPDERLKVEPTTQTTMLASTTTPAAGVAEPEAAPTPLPVEPKLEELAPLPEKVPSRAKGKARGSVAPRRSSTTVVVSAASDCVVNSSFRDYAHRRQGDLRAILGAWVPEVMAADEDIDNGLAAGDCRRVKAAMGKLELMAGVEP
jgi:serine/threonine-protein kinase